jgi:hypothetical protein
MSAGQLWLALLSSAARLLFGVPGATFCSPTYALGEVAVTLFVLAL